jgi:hypothetical protein
MFKRVRWMGMGAVAGVGASTWAQHRLRRTLQDHPSIQTGAGLVAGARRVARDVGAAVADGRQAMTQREATLRADLDRRHGGASRPEPVDTADGRFAARGRPELRVVDATSGTPRPAGPRDSRSTDSRLTDSRPTGPGDGPGHPSGATKPAGPDDHVPARTRRRQGR